jgi:hypothetical protein
LIDAAKNFCQLSKLSFAKKLKNWFIYSLPFQADNSEMRPEPVIRAEPVYRVLPLPPGAGHHRELPLRDSHQYR